MSAECAFRQDLTGSNTAEGHAEAGQYHVTGLDLLLKALGLVQSTWEAINEEAAAAALQHSLLQQPNRDLQHCLACQLDSYNICIVAAVLSGISSVAQRTVQADVVQNAVIQKCQGGRSMHLRIPG